MSTAAATTATKERPLTQHEATEIKKKKIWEVATSPRKNMMMMIFMMWMAGNELSIFPIMITGQALYNPISSIIDTHKTFSNLVDTQGDKELEEEISRGKMAFIAHQFVFLALGLVKCYYLGLVPTSAIDWIDHKPYSAAEYAVGFHTQ
eukprot:Rhum_TRINITY_DN10717_c0_g1::Rhum_TRINITY_DN10717_c0_g1_i1::g.39840::m.39840